MSLPRLASWLMLAFLLGIAAHSIHPYAHPSILWILIPLVITIFIFIVLPSHRSMTRVTCCVTIAFTLGLLRFSLTQPSLPRNLIFANPKGLAIAAPMSQTANHLDPRHWLFRARTSIKRRAQSRFSSDQAALLTGILYGERELSKEAKTAFRHAGLLHLIAVSGSNMTIIVVISMRILLFLHLSRRQAFIFTVLTITTFTLFVGPSASVVRAAIMGLLVELAPLAGRLIHPPRLLLVAAVLFTLWHPWALVFDVSFALSFLAMLGLLTYGRAWNERLEKHIRSSFLRESLASTVAATLLTTPYTAWAFGSFTLWGLITNLLILPLIPWTMLLGVLALLVPSEAMFTAFVLPAQGCLQFILWIASFADQLRLGYFDRTFLSFPWLIASYILLFLFTPSNKKKIVSAPPVTTDISTTSGLTELSLYEP